MELTIRPEDLRPGVTLVDVLALLKHGADAAAAASAGLSPLELDSDPASSPEAAEEPRADADGHVPGAMVEGPQPPIELPGQLALPLMMAAGVSTPLAATTPLEAVEERLATPASPVALASPAPAATAASAPSPAPAGSAPSPSEPSEEGRPPQRAELIALARTALQGGRRDAVKTLLSRAGVKRMSEIPDDALTDAITELKELLS